jgi:hypothetical protein
MRGLLLLPLLLSLSVLPACGPPSRRAVSSAARAAAQARARQARTPPPADWFWEPVDADVRPPSRKPLELPVADGSVTREGGAGRLWESLPAEARERLRRDGLVVLAGEPRPGPETDADRRTRSVGGFHAELQSQRLPQLLTVDALFAVVHSALERALAESEEVEIAPLLESFLERLDAHLAADEPRAKAELAEGYRLARGLVAVARSLGTTTPLDLSPELVPIVAQERGNIEGSAGAAPSPLLGVPIDYTQFAPPRASTKSGPYRALAWLAAAPLTLVARSEAPGAAVNVGQARTNARAAMLLARLCAREVDPTIHAAYARILRWLAFVYGSPDDLTLAEIDELATSAGVDVTKPEDIANVVRVDRVRARALAGRAPSAADGPAGTGRAAIGARLFGGHAAADSLVLQGLVGVPVGLAEDANPADAARVRQARRVLPSALDVAAWLGAKEARPVLHELRVDAFDGYDAALATLVRTRPDESTSALHASVYGSLLDALLAYGPGASGSTLGSTPAIERAHLESILASWTFVRHLGQALGRTRGGGAATTTAGEVGSPAGAVPVFVEPAPEAIARLVGVVRQARRGLEKLTPSATGGLAVLGETEEILRVALRAAERQASDEPFAPDEASATAALPARLARLEADPSLDVGPVAVVVFSDPPAHRVLATGTGRLERVLTLHREANKDEPTLVVGAHVAHHEIVEGFEHAPGVLHGVRPGLGDDAWRARLKASPPARPAWVGAFRVGR